MSDNDKESDGKKSQQTKESTANGDKTQTLTYDFRNMSIHQVAREGDVAVIEKMMEKFSGNPSQMRKRLNMKDENKLTPLHYAARYSNYNMMKYLINNGANVGEKDEDKASALHFVAKYKKKLPRQTSVEAREPQIEVDYDNSIDGKSSCLQLLVDAGALLNEKDKMGLTPLHHACTRGNLGAVRKLVQCSGIGLEMTENQGMTGLHLACLYGFEKIVSCLLDAGANIRCRDKDLTTPFHLACAEGSKNIATLLLKKADDILKNAPKRNKGDSFRGMKSLLQDTDVEKNLPLHLAIENGHLELVEFLINHSTEAGLGTMVEAKKTRDETCLHLAVSSNNLDIVKLLLEHGSNINARNSSLVTPLFMAAQRNSQAILKLLLDNKANIEMKDSDFMTPLLVVCKHGHTESLNYLLEYGADVTATDKDDRTCIMWCAEEERTDALIFLLKHPVACDLIEERDRGNNTALHMASMKGHVSIVKILLEYKASADIKNDDDQNTLHMAALHGNDMIIPELISRDRNIINTTDEEANTALHLAAIGGNVKSAVVLLQLGANLGLRNSQQWTPLDCAAAFGYEKPARALLESGATIQPRGKAKQYRSKTKVSALHLAAHFGHVEMVELLLQWKADVMFRSAEGKNALDFAIDNNQKDCVLALLKHDTWKFSLRNSFINPVNGRMLTPMRKLIKKMPDMAEVVYNKCIVDNGKKPEDEDYKITLDYEFLDDMYMSTTWMEWKTLENLRKENISEEVYDDDAPYTVYDENDRLTKEAMTYTRDSKQLQSNHPLQIMVSSKREKLLLHPVVTGLLNYKWKSYGRYVYYVGLLIFTIYLALLNTYMLNMPKTYEIDWKAMAAVRMLARNHSNLTIPNAQGCDGTMKSYIEDYLQNEAQLNLNNPDDLSLHCFYYREEAGPPGCNVMTSYAGLRYIIAAFSVFNMMREFLQCVSQRLGFLNFTNVVEVTLYSLAVVICVNYHTYTVEAEELLTANLPDKCIGFDSGLLHELQANTEIRQEWQMEIGAFAVFLSWMGLLLLIQKIPHLGIFVVMFTDILETFARFFLVFLFFILGFAFAFYILLGNQYVFMTWYDSIIKTTVMMIGESDYSDIFISSKGDNSYPAQVFTYPITLILFVVFLAIMTIIIMNLLVGLAVGDIIEVQENATLERLGMQVALALDVEFNLPEFFRKKICRRKQTIEVNKYRKANPIIKLLFEDSDLTAESLAKKFNKEIGETDEMKNLLDKVVGGMAKVGSQLTDVVAEQSEVKFTIMGIRSLVKESHEEDKIHAKELEGLVHETNTGLETEIKSTKEGLHGVTLTESTATRGRVDTTNTMMEDLKQDIARSEMRLTEVKMGLESKLDAMRRHFEERSFDKMEKSLSQCKDKIDKSQDYIMERLQEMRLILARERFKGPSSTV